MQRISPTGCVVVREEIDWNMADLLPNTQSATATTRLKALCDALGIRDLYAPLAAHANAHVISAGALSDVIDLGHVRIHKNSRLPADGVIFSPDFGDQHPTRGFVFTSLGCPLVTMQLGDLVCLAHAGRGSLHNPGADRSRFPSVITAMIDALTTHSGEFGYGLEIIQVSVHGSIRPNQFGHEFTNPRTTNLREWCDTLPTNTCWFESDKSLYLDLPGIIAHQCDQAGIRKANIDLTDAYLPESAPTTRNRVYGSGGRMLRSLILARVPT